MEIASIQVAGHTVLRPVGALSVATASQVRRVLGKALTDGRPVVVDLGRLTVAEPGTVTVFVAALHGAGGWPAASLVLYAADAATARKLATSSVPSCVPLVDDLPAALARTARRPEVVRRSFPLAAHAAVDAVARTAVREACDDWTLRPVIREVAVVVAAELVTNAVAHAGGPTALAVEHNGRRLRLRVRDRTSAPPARLPAPHTGVGTHGLDVVDRLTSGWGTTPHADGKTVWAWLPATAAG
jgi:hypothetical protein